MIKINKIHDNCVCKLYDPNEKLIGEIDSYYQLTDVRIQIKRKQLEGYYLIWYDKSIEHERCIVIDKNGSLDSWPKGFFELFDDQLTELIDLGTFDYEQYYLTL